MSVVFGLLKMSFGVPKNKARYHFRKGDKTLRFREMDKKSPNKFENTQVLLE